MDVIFEGALSRSWGMADVLKAVMGVENQPFGILRVSADGSRLNGKLAIADGSFIVGAVCSDAISDVNAAGYEAIKQLLTAKEGNFAFLDTAGKRPSECEEAAIFISIEKLLAHLPDLPPTAAELFDEKSLLDRVFGAELTESKPSREVAVQAELASEDEPYQLPQSLQSISGSSSQQKPAWQMFQPLLSDSSTRNKAVQTARQAFPYDFEDTGAHKQSLDKLRSKRADALPWYQELLRESLLSKVGLIWIGLILILSLVATLLGTTALNPPGWLTIQRNPNDRTQP